MADNFTIFYAWQSDSPQSTNRNFIESSAEKALRQINEEGVIEAAPRLDKDTKDVPGIPDIANTILEKIRSADVFLADISFVGSPFGTDQESEDPIPNPNVMIELGYALAELGPERIIYVMNTHYGPEEKLPFDLRNRRWPITYQLSPEADKNQRSSEKEKLTATLKRAIEAIAKLPMRKKRRTQDQHLDDLELLIRTSFKALYDRQQQDVESIPETEILKLRDSFIERVLHGEFEDIKVADNLLTLMIMPRHKPAGKVDLFSNGIRHNLPLKLKPLGAGGWDSRSYAQRFVTFASRGVENERDSVTEITEDGIICAAGHRVIAVESEFLGEGWPSDIQVIPSIAFERNIIDAVSRYLEMLVELGIEGPWLVAIGFVNMSKSYLHVGIRYGGGSYFEGSKILPPVIEISKDVPVEDHSIIAKELRPLFDFVWREYSFPGSLNFSESGEWVGQF